MTQDRPVTGAGVVTKLSSRPVADTVARFTGLVGAKGIKLFAVIDQAAEARQAGLDLRDTTLVMFGSPAAGTPVMDASPLAALDLPLKVLVWDDAGQTKVSYNAPAWLAARHHLSTALAPNLAGIDALTDALVAQ
jgi:uncharacterized protein (DUF302 family)